MSGIGGTLFSFPAGASSAQGPLRNTARAIRIFRGIMIVEWKHICPQKSLIFPAVTTQLGRKWWLWEHREPRLKRKKCTKFRVASGYAKATTMHGGSTQAPWRADGHGDAHTDCAWKVRTQNPKLSPQDPFPVPSDRGASDVLPHDPESCSPTHECSPRTPTHS